MTSRFKSLAYSAACLIGSCSSDEKKEPQPSHNKEHHYNHLRPKKIPHIFKYIKQTQDKKPKQKVMVLYRNLSQ